MNEENVPDDGIHRSLEEMRKAAMIDWPTPSDPVVLHEEMKFLGFFDDEQRENRLHRPLTPIEEQILVYTEEANRQFAQKDRANRLRRNFATPPPMERIMIEPSPHLPEMQFPRRPVALTDAEREELQKQIEAGFANFTETVKGLVQVIGPVWQEMIDEVGKALREISQSLPDERSIHPGELRDERGIKQPSHTPPFWATAPGRTSKKRGKR